VGRPCGSGNHGPKDVLKERGSRHHGPSVRPKAEGHRVQPVSLPLVCHADSSSPRGVGLGRRPQSSPPPPSSHNAARPLSCPNALRVSSGRQRPFGSSTPPGMKPRLRPWRRKKTHTTKQARRGAQTDLELPRKGQARHLCSPGSVGIRRPRQNSGAAQRQAAPEIQVNRREPGRGSSPDGFVDPRLRVRARERDRQATFLLQLADR
jgi:hypothetical protein